MGVIIVLLIIIIIVAVIVSSQSKATPSADAYEPVDTFTTLMPIEAVSEIKQGRLPRLNTDKVILKDGEYCHFIDKAYMLHDRVLKRYHSESKGVSYPSLLSVVFDLGPYSIRHSQSVISTQIEEIPVTERFKGLLFITNRRIIFVSKKSPFDKPFKSLTAKLSYTDGIEFQFGGKYMSLLVPDGRTADSVVELVLARRTI